jgi:hypothetical protein
LLIQNFPDFYSQCKSRHFYLFDVLPPRFISTLMDIIRAIFSTGSSYRVLVYFPSIHRSSSRPPLPCFFFFIFYFLSLSLVYLYLRFLLYFFVTCDVEANVQPGLTTGREGGDEITRERRSSWRGPVGRPIQPLYCWALSCRQLLPPLTCGEYCPPTIIFFFFGWPSLLLRIYYKRVSGEHWEMRCLCGQAANDGGRKGRPTHTIQRRATGPQPQHSPGVEFICLGVTKRTKRQKKKKKKSQKTQTFVTDEIKHNPICPFWDCFQIPRALSLSLSLSTTDTASNVYLKYIMHGY